jgi:hypothetical protein
VQRLGIGDALNYFAEHANNLPGFRMFTLVLASIRSTCEPSTARRPTCCGRWWS